MRVIIFSILLLLFSQISSASHETNDDWELIVEKFRYIPAQHAGRIKPMDTIAKNALLLIHGSQSIKHSGKTLNANKWLMDLLMNSKHSKDLKLIRIENSDLLGMLGHGSKERSYYSIQDLETHFQDIYNQFTQAQMVEESLRDNFQKDVIVLWQQITTYLSLSNTLWVAGIENVDEELDFFESEIKNKSVGGNNAFENKDVNRLDWFRQRYQFIEEAAYFDPLFPTKNKDSIWSNMGDGLLSLLDGKKMHPAVKAYAAMITSYQKKDARSFDLTLNEHLKTLQFHLPEMNSKMKLEVFYNDYQPFFISIVIYLLVFILTVLSWIVWRKWLKNISIFLLIIGFSIHSLGLILRMIIEVRPPVTNLYSSAIFVGWGIVFFSLILEKIFRNSIGRIVGAISGFFSLIVAHHLIGSDDTIEVMRAVLNSNFWLSTHVVAITLGYSASFLAGSLGVFFIFWGLFTKNLNREIAKNFSKMLVGVICFSLLLTVIGTILGGIWADRSWGRFWGWDPKENGALLIILWQAIILHTRIWGYAKRQSLMVMAVFCNVVTSLSWFGVNMLGVGLHSYGFMDGAFLTLALFILFNVAIMCLGSLPSRFWRSRECLS